jgi:hypothetical protein
MLMGCAAVAVDERVVKGAADFAASCSPEIDEDEVVTGRCSSAGAVSAAAASFGAAFPIFT